MTAPRCCGLAFAFVSGLVASACVLPNPDHCQNLDADPNAWCSTRYADERPYCSPCEAEHHGCVAAEPSEDECPEYTPEPAPQTDSDTGTTETG